MGEVLNEYFSFVFAMEKDMKTWELEEVSCDILGTGEEVLDVLECMEVDKSPGPDQTYSRTLQEAREKITGKIGCDGIIGSAAKEDRCGMCNGDDKSCEIIKGDFNQSRGMGYVEATVIPVGARRIRVVEEKPAHSFLALKDSTKQSINSDWKIELPGEFPMAGTTVRYVRRGLWEKMSAKGPTKTPLHLMVLLFHDQSYVIHYEYTISVNNSIESSSEVQKQLEPFYLWTNTGWGDCSVHCGGGTVSR
ncbi:hypothetical protein chiPu_0010981 [Chiloscyllium punctatum]|uniref:ADAMTS/ADAMTS-like Spacer 1 domain-containing protein n=1 Tax=Chiloscyllium punctatum TaxID=137246 RepID=A0A401SQ57_CHIPU|nr:hypothetical protein [Chiloscyllium punctatum]